MPTISVWQGYLIVCRRVPRRVCHLNRKPRWRRWFSKDRHSLNQGLAQIVRTGWYRSVHVKSFDSHRARAHLGARTQLVGMTTRLSKHIRGVLKTFGLPPGAMRGLPFDRKVEAPLLNRSDGALIVRPMLVAWWQLREQIVLRQGDPRISEIELRVPAAHERAGHQHYLPSLCSVGWFDRSTCPNEYKPIGLGADITRSTCRVLIDQ
jgi:hypothetical protein